MYKYGMRLRGFSIGCQPMHNLIGCEDDQTGKYHDILFYNRKLSDRDVRDYELDYLGTGETPYRTRYEVGEEHPVAYEIEAEGEE